MKVLYIETFYGGSHRYFADRWMETSIHDFQFYSLPDRFWKWRQAGAALHFADKLPDNLGKEYDVCVISGMIDLSHLKALRPDLPPVLLYLHENQFAYPLSSGEVRDFRYGITDLVNVCAADLAVFNSQFNIDSLSKAVSALFRRLPDAVPHWTVKYLSENSRVAYPGIDVGYFLNQVEATDSEAAGDSIAPGQSNLSPEVPLVIWNHRHEHDKAPQIAFRALEALSEQKVAFRLAILGERYTDEPEAFDRARRTLKNEIICDSYPSRKEYVEWLKNGDVVISSAVQENFGISVLEAVAAGCVPILPEALAYPEVIPAAFHKECLWKDEKELLFKLEHILSMSGESRRRFSPLRESMKRFDWIRSSSRLDSLVEETAATKK